MEKNKLFPLTSSLSGCRWACPQQGHKHNSVSPFQTGRTPGNSPALQIPVAGLHQISSYREEQYTHNFAKVTSKEIKVEVGDR